MRCPRSRAMFPGFVALARHYERQRLDVAAFSTDDHEDKDDIPDFLTRYEASFGSSIHQAVAVRGADRCARSARLPPPDAVEPAVRGDARSAGERGRSVGWRDHSRGDRRRAPIPARAITDPDPSSGLERRAER